MARRLQHLQYRDVALVQILAEPRRRRKRPAKRESLERPPKLQIFATEQATVPLGSERRRERMRRMPPFAASEVRPRPKTIFRAAAREAKFRYLPERRPQECSRRPQRLSFRQCA